MAKYINIENERKKSEKLKASLAAASSESWRERKPYLSIKLKLAAANGGYGISLRRKLKAKAWNSWPMAHHENSAAGVSGVAAKASKLSKSEETENTGENSVAAKAKASFSLNSRRKMAESGEIMKTIESWQRRNLSKAGLQSTLHLAKAVAKIMR